MTSLKKHHRIAKALSALTVLALPALATAPTAATAQGATLRGAATPAVDARHARVIVKYKADGALMRESTLSARDPDRVVVQHAARLSQRLGIALRDGFMIAPRTQVLHARDVSSAALVARLQADPDVEYAEVDERVHFTAVPSDPLYLGGQPGNITPTVGQWYLRAPDASIVSAINAQAAWDVTTGSSSVIVAVLDTGVRPDHPDLAGKLLPGYDFVSADADGSFTSANDGSGRDPDASDPGDWVSQADIDGALKGEGCTVSDSSWHGTQTSALIGAATNNGTGMASVGWNVRILPVRVLGKCGGFQSDVVAGMYWAAGINIPSGFGTGPTNSTPAKVLNMSLGSATTTCSKSYQDAMSAVTNAGASVVVSAGNDAGLAVGQPANCAGAIGVGGLRQIGTKVGFSDVGPQITISAPAGNCVLTGQTDPCLYPILTATNTGTTTPGTSTYSDSFNISVGTSFSAPLVAGTVGLMLSANPALTPAQLRVGLMKTARAFPSSGSSFGVPVCHAPDANTQDECYCTTSTCGAGMLDAGAAARAAASAKAWVVASSSEVAVGSSVSLDGSASWAASPSSINARTWSIQSGSSFVSMQVSSDQKSATVTGTSPGTVVVRLAVTDTGGNADQTDTTISVVSATPGTSSGGGTLSWPWLLGLGLAVAALRPRRR